MIERIIVSCRMTYTGLQSSREASYLERARALTRRAEALGATLAAWSAVTLAFSWDADSIEEAVTLAAAAVQDTSDGRDPWAAGLAEGAMEELGPTGERAQLAWGTPLVDAVAMARVAAPGEVLVDASVAALRSGELMVLGSKVSFDAGRRVRAARLDVRQPWRAASAAQIARLLDPPLIGRSEELDLLSSSPGTVAILRADPGLGGSRLLAELRARSAPARAFGLTASAVRAEPCGALRRAFTHIAGTEPLALDAELHAPLDRLLAGEGVSLDLAAQLITGYLETKPSLPAPLLLVDDVIEIDGPSLEACARAAARSPVPWRVVLRVDALADVPSVFGALPRGPTLELKPLTASEAAEIAEQATRGALSRVGAIRWGRRGSFTPLGVIEAVTSGLATGELAWIGDTAHARRRAAGKGSPRPASFWIAQRAQELSPEARAILVAVALLGGSAPLATVSLVVGHIASAIDATAELPALKEARWVTEPQDGWIALPTRTHREAVLQLMNEARAKSWHHAIAEAIEKGGGPLRLAEAAQHAAKAGDGPWAARLASTAARRATELGLDTASMRLVAFARAQDPASDALPVTEALPSSVYPFTHVLPGGPILIAEGPPSMPPPALMVPSSPSQTRMKAIDDLARGRGVQAVQTLRRELEQLSDAGPLERSKGSLALGFALAHMGQSEEALLAALDGLARAREGGDARGERACMLLVAKLIEGAGEDAAWLREAAEAKA